jgi:DNA-binding transcriptional MerR regulator
MMMTTTNQIPAVNQASELQLDDLDFVENILTEPTTLPAALVDDKLLQEISQIPDKMAFKIGDVSELLDIKQYVLRYWESEFDILKPKKASNNQRMYTKKDVENAFLIRKLLHRDRFSIEGARQVFRDFKQVVRREKDISQAAVRFDGALQRLQEIVSDLKKLRSLLK